MGSPPKKETALSKNVYYISDYICFVYWINVFLSSRANVDDLQTIENKSNFVSSDNMPNYVKGAFISMEDERFLNIMDSISKGQHVHYFQRLVNVRYKAEHHYSTNCKNYYYNNERSFT